MRTDEEFLQAIRKWIRSNHVEAARKLGRPDREDISDEHVELQLPDFLKLLPAQVQDVESLEKYLQKIAEVKRRRTEAGEDSLMDEYLKQQSQSDFGN
jgi:hypothetical protein